MITKSSDCEYFKINIHKSRFNNNNELICYIPTDFTYINTF